MIPIVVCCPGREPLYQGGDEVWDVEGHGQLPTYLRALKIALDWNDGPVTILEDDVETPPGFADYVASFSDFIARQETVVQWWWNGGMLQWQVDERKREFRIETVGLLPHFIHRKASKFLSLQAVTYSRPVAEMLVKWLSGPLTVPKALDGKQHMGDTEINLALRHYKKDFLIHFPPIAQHVGAESLVDRSQRLDDGFRSNPYYDPVFAAALMKRRPPPLVLYPGDYDTTE